MPESDPFVYVLALGAVLRLTHLLVDDRITLPLRTWAAQGAGPGRRFGAAVLSCTWCTSIWTSAATVALWWAARWAQHPGLFAVPALVLSLSWVASVLEIWSDPTPSERSSHHFHHLPDPARIVLTSSERG
ncbi:hypothetical protein [Streptacidiphilus cavernicola]|uniref:DUF1360 domain-containing protein n=1 Tax=Streptacidiphilus cavernicola TaxID=3342716 RepID=A0ABV6VY86_9ACTN